jgi:MFS family permease
MSRIITKALMRNPEFRHFILTRFFLTIATQMQAVVVGWEIFRLTGDPLSLGLIGLAEAVPAISVALYAGHLADISSKKEIMRFSIIAMAVCSLGLWLATGSWLAGSSRVIPLMYTCIFISGIARGFYAPTGFSFLSQLVAREHLTRASTFNSSSWQVAAIIGPALGGVLFGTAGISATLACVVIFTLVAVLNVSLIGAKPVFSAAANETVHARLMEGIRFVFQNKLILGALSLDLFSVLFGGAVALLPVFAHEILEVGAEGLGLMRAAPSLGASLTMALITLRPHSSKPGRLLLWCVGGFGISISCFGLSTHFYLSLLLLFLSGAFDSVSVVVRGNILQLQTPDHMRGRVSAVNTIFIGSSNEIGAFESGVAARLLGTIPSVIFGGSMTLLIVAYTAARSKALRMFEYDK